MVFLLFRFFIATFLHDIEAIEYSKVTIIVCVLYFYF